MTDLRHWMALCEAPAMVRVYHAQSHVVPQVLSSRRVQTYNSMGTWFDSDRAIVQQLYGQNVTAYDIPADGYLTPEDDFLVSTLGHNLGLIAKVFGDEDAEHLQEYPWNATAYQRFVALENGGNPRLFRNLRQSRDIVRKALLSPQYCQEFRSMIEAAGYRGIVWRHSHIDGAGPHDVYLLFHTDDVHPAPMTETLHEADAPRPSTRDLLDAIEHADHMQQGWQLSDFALQYLGHLSVDEIGQYDDLSSWPEVTEPDDLQDFRGGLFADPKPHLIVSPIVIITAPDEGQCHTQVGDGRGRVNYAIAHGIRLHAWHLIHTDCADSPA